MDLILNQSLLNFKRELNAALAIVKSKKIPAELSELGNWLIGAYREIENDLGQLEYLIALKDPDLHEDILSGFSGLLYKFRFISTKYLPAIYRNHDNDLLALKLLKWLHGEHVQTKNEPFLIQDGNFSILPAVGLPISYYLPVVSQQGLLFLPLFFHELGHYFYQAHKPEMDALVQVMQAKLDAILQPAFQSNSAQAKEQAEKIKRIVETWYEWTQEFFCDAIGLEIGGRTYLKAFSYYLRMQGQTNLQMPEKDLANSSHPVSWLRIRFLVERARKFGLNADADEIEKEWSDIAKTLNITEEYFGYYSPKYHAAITETLDDMVEEASPIRFKDYLKGAGNGTTSYIQLIHDAWDKFETTPKDYDAWENATIGTIIS
jgi:hypothetical protein